MSEQKPEKKVVGRTVAIALGIIAIVLLVCLVGVIANYNLQISSLNSKVNDLNSIVNFQKQETWLNKTLTINPNQNVSESFFAPLSGNVKVVGYVTPQYSPFGIWTNLTWWVVYGTSIYHVSPTPYVYDWGYPFEEVYPIFSFATWLPEPYPNIGFVIGNSGTETVTVNLTITFTY